MRIYYRNQRDFLISAIKKSPLDALVTIQEKDAGLHFLMKVDTSMSDESPASPSIIFIGTLP